MRHLSRLLAASGLTCLSLLLLAASMVREEHPARLFHPKDGEVVAIRSVSADMYLEVSPVDGLIRASAPTPDNKTALFRVMLLSKPMVDMLMDAMRCACFSMLA